MAEAFTSADTDGDESLSMNELAAMMETMAPPPRADMGQAGGMENVPSAEEIFESADTDSDGSLSVDELSHAMEEMGPPPGARTVGPPVMAALGASDGASGNGSSSSSTEDTSSASNDPADSNGDGKVSSAELLAYIGKQIESFQPSDALSQSIVDLVA